MLEHDLREESRRLTADGHDPLFGYRLVAFGPEGESIWRNPVTNRTLQRDPDGTVGNPDRWRPVNYTQDTLGRIEKGVEDD